LDVPNERIFCWKKIVTSLVNTIYWVIGVWIKIIILGNLVLWNTINMKFDKYDRKTGHESVYQLYRKLY